MRPSVRVLFLIFAASFALHVSALFVGIAVGGYLLAEDLDAFLRKRRREKLISEVMDGWTHDEDDGDFEHKGGLSRIKLSDQNQIIAARVAELLRQMP